MKFVAGLCFFCICTLIGIINSKKYSNRYKFYTALLNFNQDFKSVLSFRRDYVEKLLNKDYKFQPFNEILEQKLSNSFNKNTLNLPDFLNDEEKYEIVEFFNQMGKFDAITQSEIAIRYEELFKRKIESCDIDNKKYGLLYKKLGIIVGLIVFIIVV